MSEFIHIGTIVLSRFKIFVRNVTVTKLTFAIQTFHFNFVNS